MHKYQLSGILGLILGAAIGMAGTFLVYPFIFPPPVVNEQISDVQLKEIIASGHFIHPNPSDPVHWGKGGISIYSGGNLLEVFLESDFEAGPGPAYHVYLSSGKNIKSNNDFNSAVNTDIGQLKSFSGSQIYNVPSTMDISTVNSVVVWCEAFNQLITSAKLTKLQNTTDQVP